MSSRFQAISGTVAIAALLSLCSPVFAQSDDVDPEMRIERLENQLRQLTGQNEELQYRNRQLEERIRQLEGGAQGVPPQAQGQVSTQPNVAAAPMQTAPVQPPYRQPQPAQQGAYEPQIASPAPIVQEAPPPGAPGTRRRGDAFDPNQNPNAPGAPRALGGGQMPMQQGAPIGAPGGRGAGEPLDLANTGGRYPQPQAQPPQAQLPQAQVPPAQSGYPAAGGGLATQPPTPSPRDEFDLGIGYMQRKDYALAEQTMKNFAQKYPSDPLLGDAQYWLGESYFQRQQYRDAAEAFLAVTTKYDKSGKAPDSLLRLGQSLAALKEKEAACAAFGEVGRKYPRASAGVKAAIDREQKRVKC
jgi:tol-pal system protein YbgF